jgi:hypothetical protein
MQVIFDAVIRWAKHTLARTRAAILLACDACPAMGARTPAAAGAEAAAADTTTADAVGFSAGRPAAAAAASQDAGVEAVPHMPPAMPASGQLTAPPAGQPLMPHAGFTHVAVTMAAEAPQQQLSAGQRRAQLTGEERRVRADVTRVLGLIRFPLMDAQASMGLASLDLCGRAPALV